ncbi:hypothetical protein EB05_00280 [Enterococcus faecium]|uniref:hypothetical protein n=1 Tax=Enterococcus faecium TaxID=1352 RepID=UPI0005EBE01A|nr:hypothetical protein [Enterococcus faecium]EGP5619828.1 hypothetical protein [Enterococcus faecium]EGP5717767.1 hypothetical protein [Enterococcus faecium]EME3534978.1 hypothetical protein [Enterococcus faecium]EME3549624.1 hypothetical protein [Enterococcus faecium]EME8127260.1 hypothetical protein [Enterococcus faecium]
MGLQKDYSEIKKQLKIYLEKNNIKNVDLTDNGIIIKNTNDGSIKLFVYNNSLKANIEKIEKNI